MADSQSKNRGSDHVRRNSSSGGRCYKRRRGHWSHARGSISAALAIAPTTTAPLAANIGNVTSSTNAATATSGGSDGGIATGQQQQLVSKQRHGRKRRRHRHSSFSGEKTLSNYALPPAVAAALAIAPKTPESREDHGPVTDDSAENKIDVKPSVSQVNGTQTPVGPASRTLSSSAPNDSTAAAGGVKKKKRRSRRKRRQWKPYYKLTAEERRELEEREEKRAERIRATRFAHGQPVAPYNTTQFLLRDRELRNGGEPDCGDLDEIVRNIRHHTRSGSCESPGAAAAASDSDAADVSSDYSDYSYLEREFDNDWLDEQRQRLEGMSKDELVKEFMDLQKQYESAQRDMRLKRLSFEEEISMLRRENERLRSRGGDLTAPVLIPERRAQGETATGGSDVMNNSNSSCSPASINQAAHPLTTNL